MKYGPLVYAMGEKSGESHGRELTKMNQQEKGAWNAESGFPPFRRTRLFIRHSYF
jgi:hypothetical protein